MDGSDNYVATGIGEIWPTLLQLPRGTLRDDMDILSRRFICRLLQVNRNLHRNIWASCFLCRLIIPQPWSGL